MDTLQTIWPFVFAVIAIGLWGMAPMRKGIFAFVIGVVFTLFLVTGYFNWFVWK